MHSDEERSAYNNVRPFVRVDRDWTQLGWAKAERHR
jgi:hypothetical protein